MRSLDEIVKANEPKRAARNEREAAVEALRGVICGVCKHQACLHAEVTEMGEMCCGGDVPIDDCGCSLSLYEVLVRWGPYTPRPVALLAARKQIEHEIARRESFATGADVAELRGMGQAAAIIDNMIDNADEEEPRRVVPLDELQKRAIRKAIESHRDRHAGGVNFARQIAEEEQVNAERQVHNKIRGVWLSGVSWGIFVPLAENEA